MSTTLPDVLQAGNMLGYAEQVRAGLPMNHLPPGLLGGATTRQIDGNTFTYTLYSGQQKVMASGAYGAASRPRTAQSVGERAGKTFSFAENMEIKAACLANLLSETGQRQALGISEVNRMIRESVTVRQNARTAYVSSLFLLNNIYLNGEGNLLHSSSGAVQTIAAPTPTTLTASATWGTATTDVLEDLQRFQAESVAATGYSLRYAIYGPNVLGYIMGNTDCRDLIIRNPSANAAVLGAGSGAVFELSGMIWMPARLGFFEDSGGTDRRFTTDDKVVFLPEVDSTWFEMIEGSTPVPGAAYSGDAAAVANAIGMQYGPFNYAVNQTDPVGVKMVYGDNFFPAIKVTGAVCTCDTVP